MPGTFPHHRLQRKPHVSDRGMHHGTCVTHVPWCKSGSLTHGGGENAPGIPGACATCNYTYLVRGHVSGIGLSPRQRQPITSSNVDSSLTRTHPRVTIGVGWRQRQQVAWNQRIMPQEQISMKFQSHFRQFYPRKCRLQNISHFVPAYLVQLLVVVWLALVTYAILLTALIERLMGPTWGPSGADRTQVGPMLASWTLLSGCLLPDSLQALGPSVHDL